MVMDAPNNDNLNAYIKEMRQFGVTDLVRTCEATYSDEILEQSGIRTHELLFPDGEPPPDHVIKEWMSLVNDTQKRGNEKSAVAVHCVAGLGRAPVLVAVALIEKGMDALDAIMFIRERRKGAINARQLKFLETYRPRTNGSGGCKACCAVM